MKHIRHSLLLLGGEINYLLRTTFNADDQGFADAQVIDTVAEGIQNGQLTVVEVDGPIAIISNKCDFTAQSSPTIGDQGLYSQAITRTLGLALLGTVNASIDDDTYFGWNDIASADFGSVLYRDYWFGMQNTNDITFLFGSSTFTNVGTWTKDTEYTFAMVLGGFDVNSVSYYAGQTKADYKYGVFCFIKGGAYTTWTLLWLYKVLNTATLYATFSTIGFEGTLDDFFVPDKDLSSIQAAIVALSTFTDSNGTSLDAIAPEIGPVWVEQSGDWDIQSNRANPDGAAIATVAVGESDGIIDCTVNGGTSDNPAIVLRFSDTSNYWYLQADRASNTIELHEVNATVDTVRASAAVTINDSTDYDLRAIAYGSTIDGFLDDGNKITYTSATLNQTAEIHGIRAETTLGEFENFAVFPRTASVYDTELNAV